MFGLLEEALAVESDNLVEDGYSQYPHFTEKKLPNLVGKVN